MEAAMSERHPSGTDRPSPLDIVRGFMTSRVLLTGMELGVFDAIDQGHGEVEALSATLHTDPRATERLLNALAAMGLLTKDDHGRFGNTVEAWRFLVTDSAECQTGALRHYANLWRSWSALTEVLRTGAPARRADASLQEDATASFMAAMEYFARQRAPEVARSIDLADAERMLDVGGGPALYSIEFCRRYPRLRATVFDLPVVLPIAREHIEDARLSDRIELQPGDYYVDEFGTGYDLVLLSSILHSNSEEQNRALLGKAFRALAPGGATLIQEFLVDDSRTDPPNAALFGINMLVNTPTGDVYSEAEITAWLEDAGFADVCRLEDTEAAQLLVGWKPQR
jgi:ubiquinone/menaquinone biosynthesis C-methylase UbiE